MDAKLLGNLLSRSNRIYKKMTFGNLKNFPRKLRLNGAGQPVVGSLVECDDGENCHGNLLLLEGYQDGNLAGDDGLRQCPYD